MKTLSNYFRVAGLTTGDSSVLTRHSHLSVVKTLLLGGHLPKIKQQHGFLDFGTLLHELFLLGKQETKGLRVSKADRKHIKRMLESLNRHPVVKKLMVDTVRENTQEIKYRGLNFSFTPDAVQRKRTGEDLKTTMCTTLQDFIDKAFMYGYFRQGVTYSDASSPKLKDFVIIGIQKRPPYQVFIVVINEHEDMFNYAKQELDFLIYFYKHYGNFKEHAEQIDTRPTAKSVSVKPKSKLSKAEISKILKRPSSVKRKSRRAAPKNG